MTRRKTRSIPSALARRQSSLLANRALRSELLEDRRLMAIYTSELSNIALDARFFQPVGSQIYFQANTPGLGYELWTSDGTVGGTHLVADIPSSSSGSSPANFTNVGGAVLFTA